MTRLDKMLKENERFTLDSKEIPVLMQRYPWIADIGHKILTKNINFTMIEEPADYIYFILGAIANESVLDMTSINMRKFFDRKKFFKLLEDYLVYIFDIKKLESLILLSKKRKRKIESIQKDIIEYILKKLGIEEDFFVLLNIKTHDEKISMKNSSRMIEYTNLLKEEWIKSKQKNK